MVVVIIVLVIILQNEPITTDTITILTRHFIILTQKQKYAMNSSMIQTLTPIWSQTMALSQSQTRNHDSKIWNRETLSMESSCR